MPVHGDTGTRQLRLHCATLPLQGEHRGLDAYSSEVGGAVDGGGAARRACGNASRRPGRRGANLRGAHRGRRRERELVLRRHGLDRRRCRQPDQRVGHRRRVPYNHQRRRLEPRPLRQRNLRLGHRHQRQPLRLDRRRQLPHDHECRRVAEPTLRRRHRLANDCRRHPRTRMAHRGRLPDHHPIQRTH